MTEPKKYKARVFGEQYALISDEDEAIVLEIVQAVDGLMKEIAAHYDPVDGKKIAVLAALKTMERLVNLQHHLDTQKHDFEKIKHMLEGYVTD